MRTWIFNELRSSGKH